MNQEVDCRVRMMHVEMSKNHMIHVYVYCADTACV